MPQGTVQFLVNNFAKNGRRAPILAASCSSRSGASNDILFVRVRSTWGVDLRSRSGQHPKVTKLVERGHVAYHSIWQVFPSPLVAFPTR